MSKAPKIFLKITKGYWIGCFSPLGWEPLAEGCTIYHTGSQLEIMILKSLHSGHCRSWNKIFWPSYRELRLKYLFLLCTNLHFISSKFLVSNAITIRLNNSNHFMPVAYQNIPCNTYASGCVHLKKKVGNNENISSQPSFFVLNSGLLCAAQRNYRYGNNLTNRKIKDLCS